VGPQASLFRKSVARRTRCGIVAALLAVATLATSCRLGAHGSVFNRTDREPDIDEPYIDGPYVDETEEIQHQTFDIDAPPAPREETPLDQIATQVQAPGASITNPCAREGDASCERYALGHTFVRLDALANAPQRSVRILQLGDSHIAADYITRTIRSRLQKRFGDGGRGYVHIEQRAQYGGRKLQRRGAWRRSRAVDKGMGTETYGLSAIQIESRRRGAVIELALRDDDRVTVFFHAHPDGGRMDVFAGDTKLGTVDTRWNRPRAGSKTFEVPQRRKRSGKDRRILRIVARAPGVRLWGTSFDTNEVGLIFDSVGPVGADARTYLQMNRSAFTDHLRMLAPDMVIIMLGGNDALRIRKGRASTGSVRSETLRLVRAVKKALPKADCMLWSPMDAGRLSGRKIVSKTFIQDVRAAQKEIADSEGCAFWDMYEAMGGTGSAARWFGRGIIMKDLIHPRSKGGDLLGHLFSVAFLASYDGTEEGDLFE
jgi:lysophospholipase L1-like esterase